jgi:type VI secretion system secreted protein VgrG
MIADDASPGALAAIQKNQVTGPPTHTPDSEENKEKKSWIDIELVDEAGKPMAGEAYQITLPDGSVDSGTLDEKGFAHVKNIDPGSCKITFPNLDKDAWEPKS